MYKPKWLDPEETGVPVAEIFPTFHRDFLFIHKSSGGASCCWSLLVFDLKELKPLGEEAPSSAPIKLEAGRPGCALGADITPTASGPSRPTHPSFYCFDGTTFAKAKGPSRMK